MPAGPGGRVVSGGASAHEFHETFKKLASVATDDAEWRVSHARDANWRDCVEVVIVHALEIRRVPASA
jgi:hypothetical protein